VHVLPNSLFIYIYPEQKRKLQHHPKKNPKLICNLFNQHSTHKQLLHPHTHTPTDTHSHKPTWPKTHITHTARVPGTKAQPLVP